MFNRIAAATAVAFPTSAGAAQAMPTFFSDRGAFNAAAGPLLEERFNDPFSAETSVAFDGFSVAVGSGPLVGVSTSEFGGILVSEGRAPFPTARLRIRRSSSLSICRSTPSG
ncbi:MAG: hypothetical protein AAF192_13610 [Pseudomonadota bacterium]